MFLLRESERSVTDICMDVGFTSLGTFSRTFHEMVGMTPIAYRARDYIVCRPYVSKATASPADVARQ